MEVWRLQIWLIMSAKGMRQGVEKVGSGTVDQSICLMADIKLAQFALLMSSLSNTLVAGFNFGENKGGDMGMFVSAVNIRWSEIKVSHISIEYIKLFGQKIKSNMLEFRVSSATCWLKNKRSERWNKGHWELGFDQFIRGKLKSPGNTIFGNGAGIVNIYCSAQLITSIKSQSRHEGGL